MKCDFVDARDARAVDHENNFLFHINDFEINSTIRHWQPIVGSLEKHCQNFIVLFVVSS